MYKKHNAKKHQSKTLASKKLAVAKGLARFSKVRYLQEHKSRTYLYQVLISNVWNYLFSNIRVYKKKTMESTSLYKD